MATQKTSVFTALTFLALVVAALPVLALISAWIYAGILDACLAKQYGAGPSYQSWYGISVLVVLATQHLVPTRTSTEEDKKPLMIAAKLIGAYVGMAICLAMVMFVCAALGWK